MEGAYVTRQVTGKRETIEIARRLATQVIDAHLGKITGTLGGNAMGVSAGPIAKGVRK